MYKNRLGIWIGVVVIWLTITSFMNIEIKSMLIEKQKINVQCDADASFKSKLKFDVDKMYINIVNNNPDVIIKTASNEQIDGFHKLDDYIYSPIVMFSAYDFIPQSLFYQMGSNVRFVNMKTLAEAVIEEKTLGELGWTDERYSDNKVLLCLPSPGTLYYDAAIEAIYIGLNDNKELTDENRKRIEPTVSKLIEKAEKVNDISKEISELTYGEFKVFIGPEFILNGSSFYTSTGRWYYFPVYFEKSKILKYDIFVKNDNEELEQIVKDMIIENKDFPKQTIYRTSFSHDYKKIMPCGGVLDELEVAN